MTLTASAAGRTLILRDGWTMSDGTRRYTCSLPATVMGVLTAHGEYPGIMEGMAYKSIDRTRFDHPFTFSCRVPLATLREGERVLLHLHGVSYRADVRWNGQLVASSDSVYGPLRLFDIDVTDYVKPDNTLSITITRAQDGEPNHGYVDWNVRPADENMGLLRAVKLHIVDGVRLSHPAVTSVVDTATLASADLTVHTVLVNPTDRSVAGQLCGRYEGGAFTVPMVLKAHERRDVAVTPAEAACLHVSHPRLWWCAGMGQPNLYHLSLSFVAQADTLDQHEVKFGVRQVDAILDRSGHRVFRLNGRPVLIRGAGWVDDIFMRNTPADYANELSLVNDMDLNTIRFEGFWGTSDRVFSLCDSLGIMIMDGLSCQWEWDNYVHTGVQNDHSALPDTPEMQRLVTVSLRDQVLNLRHHPSIICWMIGSDHVPYPSWEKAFRKTLSAIDDRPIQISAANRTSSVSGPSGVKMSGPYEYEGPAYYFDPRSEGGADGFNTETSLGPQLPVREDVVRTVGQDHEWPVSGNPYYDYHCTASATAMNSLRPFVAMIDGRFGASTSLPQFLQRANVVQMEGAQSLFAAFRAHEPQATGVVHWMLNSAWPSFYWQLYDWYGVPTSAYYGVKRANRHVQLVYDYSRREVYAVNSTPEAQTVKARIRFYDLSSYCLLDVDTTVTATPQHAVRVGSVLKEATDGILFLSLTDADGQIVTTDCWVAKENDEYDWKKANWYETPIKQLASYRGLNALPSAKVTVKVGRKGNDGGNGGGNGCVNGNDIDLMLINHTCRVAYCTELVAVDAKGMPVPYAFFTDNYFSLMPHEHRAVRLHCPADSRAAAVKVRTWNTGEQTVRLSR
jgi:exo-1,4-beta-D-glucosaminidase